MSIKQLAIILGAGPGTGQALGLAFARTHKVALLARNVASLDAVTATITAAGGVARPFACDASSRDSIQAALDRIRADFPDHQLKVRGGRELLCAMRGKLIIKVFEG